MRKYKAAAVQLNSQPDIDANLEQAEALIREAASDGAQLVVLPENYAFLGDQKKRIELAGVIREKAEQFLEDTASSLSIYLLGGGHPVPAGTGKMYNRSILFGPDGTARAVYDKIHLFDVDLAQGESYRESDYVEGGKPEPVVCHDPILGGVGLTICYDLRFPELYRSLAFEGAEIFCIPSAFTETTGKAHWEPLLRARAIENLCYVIAPAQCGVHGSKRRTYGHAMMINPWGEIISQRDSTPGYITAEIDPETVQNSRTKIPALQHRKL